MGLDTTHGCWHGAYSGFNRFRTAVAVAAKEHFGYEPDYSAHPHRAFLGWWDYSGVPDGHPYGDVLDVFFIHSDCDGYIFPTESGPLADKLDALVGYLADDDQPGYLPPRERLRQFIAGLRAAANEWEVVGFH